MRRYAVPVMLELHAELDPDTGAVRRLVFPLGTIRPTGEVYYQDEKGDIHRVPEPKRRELIDRAEKALNAPETRDDLLLDLNITGW